MSNAVHETGPQSPLLLTWWHGSIAGRLQGLAQRWGQSSHVVSWLPTLELAIAVVFFSAATQSGTAILGLCLAVLFGLLLMHGLTRSLAWTPAFWGLAAYWGIATLATLSSPLPALALDGWLKLTLYLGGFVSLHQLCREARSRTVLIAVVLLGSIAMSSLGIRQHVYGAAELATWTDPDSNLAGISRAYSFLGNPNLLAGYLIPIIPLGCAAFWSWPGWPRKLLAATATAMNLACLIYTYSRGGLVGLAAMLLVGGILIVSCFPSARRWLIPALIGGAGLALTLGLLSSSTLRQRLLSIFSWRGDSSNNFRITVWLTVITMIGDFFWLGIGPGNDVFNRLYPLYQRPNFNALGAYSVPLELTLETGILGAIAFAALLITIVWLGWQRRRQVWVLAALVAIAGMGAHGLVDTVWYRPQVQMLWWLAVALITAAPPATPEASDKTNYLSDLPQ